MTHPEHIADYWEKIPYYDNGGDWIAQWVPPDSTVPDGKRHGSAALCMNAENKIVLVGEDTSSLEFPGGRPEHGENWRETLDREIEEEACATVDEARMLGYILGECSSGHEAGLVLVRSVWWAKVTLAPWEPKFEKKHRKLVSNTELFDYLRIPKGVVPFFRRWVLESRQF